MSNCGFNLISLLLGASIIGCSSAPATRFATATAIAGGLDTPNDKAMSTFNANLKELKKLSGKDYWKSGNADSDTDRFSIFSPLSELTMAMMDGRMNRIGSAETHCWNAIRLAEENVGSRIVSIARRSEDSRETGLFVSCGAYFRREKFRRAAFALLAELYRKAGEKDLLFLAQMQVGVSSFYLRSPTCHAEEESVREIENEAWSHTYDRDQSEVQHLILMISMALLTAGAGAANSYSAAQYQTLSYTTPDPYAAAAYQQQAMNIRMQNQIQIQQNVETMVKLDSQHRERMESMQMAHERWIDGAVLQNVRTVALSETTQALPQYRSLVDAQEKLDNYVRRNGFDKEAIEALIKVRASLDELSRAVQQRAHGSR